MKWSVQQLRKLPTSPYPLSITLDFHQEIETIEDILDIEPTTVTGSITKLDLDSFRFDLHIKTKLIIACALTLEPVEYPLDIDYSDVFSLEENEEFLPIINNTVNLDEMVWTTILVNKPIRVVRDDAYEILAKRKIKLEEDIPDDDV